MADLLASTADRTNAIELLYADDALLVLDKPAGMLCVPGRGADKQDCLSARVQRLYPDALVVHRLDMATSGLVLMARGLAAQRTLSRAFALRQVSKRYQAVVGGQVATPAGDWAEIDLAISPDWPNRPLRVIDPLHGKPSQTRYRVIRCDAPHTTRLALEPVTGRTHQLRLHLSAIGHPIVGDALYAPSALCALSARLLLHACSLRLLHPLSGQAQQFDSAVPF